MNDLHFRLINTLNLIKSMKYRAIKMCIWQRVMSDHKVYHAATTGFGYKPYSD